MPKPQSTTKAAPAVDLAAVQQQLAELVKDNASVVSALRSMRDMLDLALHQIDGASAPAEVGPAAKKATKAAAKTAPEPEPEPDEDDEQTAEEYAASLKKLGLPALRNLAIEAGFDKADVEAEDDKKAIIEALVGDKFGNGDDNDADEDDDADEDADDADDDDEDDAEDAENGVTREELEAMSEEDLKQVALGMDYSKKDLKGKSSAEIIDMILGDEGDDDDDADDADDEEDGEDDGEYWTRESLVALGRVALRQMLKSEEEMGDAVLETVPREWTAEDMADKYLELMG